MAQTTHHNLQEVVKKVKEMSFKKGERVEFSPQFELEMIYDNTHGKEYQAHYWFEDGTEIAKIYYNNMEFLIFAHGGNVDAKLYDNKGKVVAEVNKENFCELKKCIEDDSVMLELMDERLILECEEDYFAIKYVGENALPSDVEINSYTLTSSLINVIHNFNYYYRACFGEEWVEQINLEECFG